MAVLSKGGVFF